MPYANFLDAWLAKNPGATPPAPPPTPAQTTWTPSNLQNLANAYAYGYTNPVNPDASNAGNPTWTPPAEQNAQLPNPIQPVKFDPMGDLSYAGGTSALINADTHATSHHDYNTASGMQNYGLDEAGNPIAAGNGNYNPFSQAAVLQRNYDNTKRGTVNNYAASGQLYSGALKNAEATNAYNYSLADDRLKRSAIDYFHNNDYSLTQQLDQSALTKSQLLGPAFDRFLQGQRGY